MNPALSISKTGIQAQDAQLQAIANNLANVNTVGFKRDRLNFEDMFYRVAQAPGAQVGDNTSAPGGVQFGNGVRLAGSQKVFTPGNLQNTQNELDVAIIGRGFLQVEMPNGDMAYTRAGQLQRNAEGRLVTVQGLPLVPEITLPANTVDVRINAEGVVSVTEAGAAEPTDVGQLQLADFVNPSGLLALGDNLFRETVASGPAMEGVPGEAALGTLKAGALEGSNVLAVEEMVNMITVQRAYEMNTKVLSAGDNMMQSLAQVAR